MVYQGAVRLESKRNETGGLFDTYYDYHAEVEVVNLIKVV